MIKLLTLDNFFSATTTLSLILSNDAGSRARTTEYCENLVLVVTGQVIYSYPSLPRVSLPY